MVIGWDDVLDRAMNQEKFINQYPNSVKIDDVKKLYTKYVGFILFGLNNMPLFSYDSKVILYDIFGEDQIKVVEGRQAVLLSGGLDMPEHGMIDSTQEPREIDEGILQQQREIDHYLFEDHAEEIKEKGFKVTHTGPSDDYIEIGITLYTEENAKYLYDIFGEENVRIIDGQQAEIYQTSEASDGIEVDIDSIEEPSKPELSWIYIAVGALMLLIAAGLFVKRKQSK